MTLWSIILALSVFNKVHGDFRIPILTAPLASLPAPSFKSLVDTTQEYFKKVTFYEIWQTPGPKGSVITTFDEMIESTVLIMYFESYILYERDRLSVKKLEIKKLYDCPDCFTVKNADIIAATNLTEADLSDVAGFTVKEIHEFAVKAMEKKFHFNMAELEQKNMRLSLEVTNDDWSNLFVPDIVSATINFSSKFFNVTIAELGELLNKNSSTIANFNINQIERIFLPEFEDLITRKNLFETQVFLNATAKLNMSQWQSRTMAHYTNETARLSVRHLQILYRWDSAQLFALENIPLSVYFSACNFSVAGSAFDLCKSIFGHNATPPTCNTAFVLSRSLNEDEARFNISTITVKNILSIIRHVTQNNNWFDIYPLLFTISEGIWMETPRINQVKARLGQTNAEITDMSVSQIANAIRTLNESGVLQSIMSDNYPQYLSLLLQTYSFSKSSLALLTERTVAQIDGLTIQEAHNLVFEALYIRYNISEFLSRVSWVNIDNFLAINLPSFEWYRLVQAAIRRSFEQLSNAFSTNLTVGGGVSVVTLADGTSSIQIDANSTNSSFVISTTRLASCLGSTVSGIYGRTLPSYQALYQTSAVDLINKKIVLETEYFNALLTRLGITFENIADSETVGQTIENRVRLNAAELQCMYDWSAQFTSFLSVITWRNVSSFHESGDYISWPLYRIAAESKLCFTKPCDVNAECTNTIGSYFCTCRYGFSGNGTICDDIDECALGTYNCSVNANCNNIDGSYLCQCKTGYSGNGHNCIDINECNSSLHNCHVYGDCLNTNGSFSCSCRSGFNGNGTFCIDIDECTLGTRTCSVNAECTNTNGSYMCQCNRGFSGSGSMCTDIDECDQKLHDCIQQAECVNNLGSFSCSCRTGFSGNGTFCQDIDECTLGIHGCSVNADCTNTNGSYMCQCNTGFVGNGSMCADIDECDLKLDDCIQQAECVNNPGSFSCSCKTGFSGNGSSCQDVDECVENIDNCHDKANCSNTIGSHTCQCQAGYDGNGVICNDIDECLNNLHDCREKTVCINNNGSFTCSCKPGYSGNGIFCQDVDECVEKIDDCHDKANCSNTIGNYTCLCQMGYEGNGMDCIDVDECVENIDDCHHKANCSNAIGSHTCLCQAGYQGDGIHCVDIKECLTYQCGSPDATCNDIPGSFACTCNVGYIGDGYNCKG